MEVTIFESLSASNAIKKALTESRELYIKALKRQYTFGRLKIMNVTKEQAIKINLGDLATINKVYFENIEVIKKFARCYQYRMSFGTRLYLAEDIIQQVYVDLRYYDFTSNKTLRHCLNCTCKTSNNGGIMKYKAYRSERKTARFLYDEIRPHNSKMEEAAELIDFVGADERQSNPETILIDREEPKLYTEAMHREIIQSLPRTQRYKYLEAFGGENVR